MKYIKINDKYFKVRDIVRFVIDFICYVGILYMALTSLMASVRLIFTEDGKIWSILLFVVFVYTVKNVVKDLANLEITYHIKGNE